MPGATPQIPHLSPIPKYSCMQSITLEASTVPRASMFGQRIQKSITKAHLSPAGFPGESRLSHHESHECFFVEAKAPGAKLSTALKPYKKQIATDEHREGRRKWQLYLPNKVSVIPYKVTFIGRLYGMETGFLGTELPRVSLSIPFKNRQRQRKYRLLHQSPRSLLQKPIEQNVSYIKPGLFDVWHVQNNSAVYEYKRTGNVNEVTQLEPRHETSPVIRPPPLLTDLPNTTQPLKRA